jgi:multidrug transporter EmrE-like cation transporter
MSKWLIPLLLLVSFEAIADIVAKYFAITNKFWIGVGALGLYVIANIFWLFALKNGAEISTGAVLFSVLSQCFAIAIGFLIYKEQITTFEWIGIVLGIIAVGFLLWE